MRKEEVSDYVSVPNAWAGGLGPSRRVVLWDTLLDGRFADDEVVVVLAHELGHHAHEHIWKWLGWYALFALPGAFLIAVATRRRGGMANPAAVPMSLLVLIVLQTLALPVDNAFSRRQEAEADWAALEATRTPGAAERLFAGFTEEALADPDTARLVLPLPRVAPVRRRPRRHGSGLARAPALAVERLCRADQRRAAVVDADGELSAREADDRLALADTRCRHGDRPRPGRPRLPHAPLPDSRVHGAVALDACHLDVRAVWEARMRLEQWADSRYVGGVALDDGMRDCRRRRA